MRKGDENMEKKKEPSGIQKAWRQLSIQNQIFLSMFLITLLGVGVLMNIVYKTSIDAIEQNYRASYQSTLKNSSRVMDMNLKNIVDVCRNFLNDEALQQILEKGNEYGGSKFASTDREKLRVIANEMASQQVWVNYIVFTDLYGHVYQLNNVNQGTYDFYNYYSDKDILEESWVKQAKAAQGKEIFFRDSILKAGTKKGFSYAKYMINPSDGQGMGYMVVGLSQKLLGKSFVMGNESFDSSNFMVVDEDDEVLLINSDGIIIRVKACDISMLGRATQGVKIMKVEENTKLITMAKVIREDEEEKPDTKKEAGKNEEQLTLV